jgi:peroxiredoxin
LDLPTLENLRLPDIDGKLHRLGDLWAERPVVLTFLRHFGCLHCRAHAARLRERRGEIAERNGGVVLVGTGDRRYGHFFADEEKIPFPLLLDDDARAASAASVETVGFLDLFTLRAFAGTRQAWREGHRVGKPGRRVTQLGATFVLGPGSKLRYAHRDTHPADTAPVDRILHALDV